MASLDGQQRAEPGTGWPRPDGVQRAGQPPSKPPRFTKDEREALKSLQSYVSYWRTGGSILGSVAAGTYARLFRKPPFGVPATVGVALLGGWIGAFIATPIGVLTGRRSLQQVKDPRHFTEVMAEMVKHKRRPGEPPSFERGIPLPGEDDSDSTQGDNIGAVTQSYAAPSPTQYGVGDGISQTSGPDPATSSSRWAQIRGDHSSPSSAWDKIRRSNSPQASGQAPNGSYGASSSAPGAFDPYPSLNDPRPWPTETQRASGGTPYPAASTFASSTADDSYRKEQSEFDAMLERERRMAEDNQGNERLGAGFAGGAADPMSRRSRW